jgi:beta-phosphoglucomutase-like phosphatase (HAD superfamily)
VSFRGAIFDVDGVLVDTPHERAWRDTLHELMDTTWSEIRAGTSYSPDLFTSELYQRVIAGKPRLSGARAALEWFGVPDVERRAEIYAEQKQQMVVDLIDAGEFHAYPDALRLVLALREAGVGTASASSSKNAGLVLQRVRLDTFARDAGLDYDFVRPGFSLLDLVDADISGRDFAQGKPHPEIFLTAAEELGVSPHECLVVEDAVSGVAAAKAGGMAALAVARHEDHEMLAAAGADLVVTSLDEVNVEALAARRLETVANHGVGSRDELGSRGHAP